MEVDTKAFDKNTARLREYFDLDVEDDTIAYYAKQGFFHPKNPGDLHTQLQTAHDMLELLNCKKSIATTGLAYILQPKRWRKMVTILHDRFRTQANFGSKFVYSVDRTLQNFFIRRLVLLRSQSTLQGCYFLASVWYVLTKTCCLHDTKYFYRVT